MSVYRATTLLYSLLFVASLLASVAAEGNIHLAKAWTRPTPPGAPGAGYLTIYNHGNADDRLLTVAAEFAKRVEIHETVEKEGAMGMVMLAAGLPIPAGSSVELKPGSYHLMFMGLSEPFNENQVYELELTFAQAGSMTVAMPVKAMGSSAHSMADHQH